MSPVTHFFMGWAVANVDKTLCRRERAIVAIAGVVPDIDGLGIVLEFLTRDSERPILWWSDYHHILTHNIGFALLVTAVSFLLSTQRWKTALLSFLSFHLHLLGDLVGSRGPGDYQWPLPYLMPFSDSLQLIWQGQWALNAWQNFVITIIFLILAFFLAWRRGYSPLEMFSVKIDRVFIETLRNRIPQRLKQ